MNINKIIIKLKGLFSANFKNLFKKFKKFNAYNDLDKKLLKYINYKEGFYIDCGANDGINQSTTWFYEKTLNWRGILIEPIPQVFEMLKKNYSFIERLSDYKFKKIPEYGDYLYKNCSF